MFAADGLTPAGGEALVAAFHQARTADYEALKTEIEGLRPRAARHAPLTPTARRRLARAVRACRERLSDLERIDFLNAPGRQEVVGALAELERFASEPARTTAPHVAVSTLDASGFQKRRWVTRPRPGVDRMASAWLIRKYIDPKATFAFVEAAAKADVPFDMYAGIFSHEGSRCTFETLAHKFGLMEPPIVRIGQIVHDLDMKETRYAPAEAGAIGRLVDGLQQLHADDHRLLEQGMTMFEALARSFEASGDQPGSGKSVRTAKRAVRHRKGR